MQENILPILRCPISRSPLTLQVLTTSRKTYLGVEKEIILEGILWADEDWFYPVIDGIPRLIVEAFLDYPVFLQKHVPDYTVKSRLLSEKYRELIESVIKKNRRTKESFAQEWGIYNYEKDKTWDADTTGMLNRFLAETDETTETIKDKWIFDAGCGNGLLDILIAGSGANIIAMDFSTSIIRANERNRQQSLAFIQGDIQFPPLCFEYFDLVHSSGVLHHTSNTEKAFGAIEPFVKKNGKLSVWLYHPRKKISHIIFNKIRTTSSKWPLKFQYYFYLLTIFPPAYIIKKMKGSKQNKREMMIDILDWFSPQYRWEHEPVEIFAWFYKRHYKEIKVTTKEEFGFNMIGVK